MNKKDRTTINFNKELKTIRLLVITTIIMIVMLVCTICYAARKDAMLRMCRKERARLQLEK